MGPKSAHLWMPNRADYFLNMERELTPGSCDLMRVQMSNQKEYPKNLRIGWDSKAFSLWVFLLGTASLL